jgi:RND family efflux transporter MFP subunit
MSKRIVITVIVLLGVVALGIKGKSVLEARKAEVENTSLPTVEAVSVPITQGSVGILSNKVPFLAQILSDKSIKLSTKLAGYVEKVYVEESQNVKKGDLLVNIDAIELRSNIEGLKATLATQQSDLALAKSIYSRNMKLFKVGGLAKEKLELSALSLKSKRSVIENTTQKITQLKHQLSYLSIRAPFDGVIDALILHEGDLAAAGKPILSMSNGKKKLRFSYAPTQVKQIKKGLTVWMKDENIGVIKSLYTTSANGLLSAEVALNKEIALPVGASITIEVLTSEAKGCILPANTLVHKKEGVYVMAYLKEKFVPIKVDVIMQDAQSVLLSKCPKASVAYGNEVKLAELPVYDSVQIVGDKHE